MKKSHLIIGFLVFLIGLLGAWLYVLFSPVVNQDSGSIYYLRQGISKRLVITELSQQNIIQHPALFSLYVYTQRNSQLKTGEYLFPKGSTPISIWRQITSGSGLYYRPFTIIPGWTFKQLRDELLKTKGLRHLAASLDDKQIMERLGYPNLSPEGEFFPDTYNYTRGDIDLAILKRAFDLMQSVSQQTWQNRQPKLPYKNSYEALIAASMIEKEGYLDSERPAIAGVLINRLNKNMLLQIDATVIYGLGNRYEGKIHKTNLSEDTVYNTYIHKGLPPTPIAMPGFASIQSAMHPQQNDYYYYVAKGDGSHQFSKTLGEHNAAIQAIIIKEGKKFNDSLIRHHMEILLGRPTLPLSIILNTTH